MNIRLHRRYVDLRLPDQSGYASPTTLNLLPAMQVPTVVRSPQSLFRLLPGGYIFDHAFIVKYSTACIPDRVGVDRNPEMASILAKALDFVVLQRVRIVETSFDSSRSAGFA